MGLAIVHRIVSRHGGGIWAEGILIRPTEQNFAQGAAAEERGPAIVARFALVPSGLSKRGHVSGYEDMAWASTLNELSEVVLKRSSVILCAVGTRAQKGATAVVLVPEHEVHGATEALGEILQDALDAVCLGDVASHDQADRRRLLVRQRPAELERGFNHR